MENLVYGLGEDVVSALIVWENPRVVGEPEMRWISLERVGEHVEITVSPMFGWRLEPRTCVGRKYPNGGGWDGRRTWPCIGVEGDMRTDESVLVWPILFAMLDEGRCFSQEAPTPA